MLKFVGRVLRFSGEYAGRLKLSFVLSFVEGLLQSVPFVLIWMSLDRILADRLTGTDVWIFTVVLTVSVIVRMYLRYWFVSLESGTGYEICERERITMGDRLRHFPMRFFSEGNLGRVSSVITVDLPFIEEMGMDALDKVISGYASTLIGCILLFGVDWRIGLITAATFAVSILIFRYLENVSVRQSPIRQRQQGELVGSILEYVQGIAVIKAFNMAGDKASRVKEAINSTRDHAIDFEVKLLKPTLLFKICFGAGTALTILTVALFALKG